MISVTMVMVMQCAELCISSKHQESEIGGAELEGDSESWINESATTCDLGLRSEVLPLICSKSGLAWTCIALGSFRWNVPPKLFTTNCTCLKILCVPNYWVLFCPTFLSVKNLPVSVLCDLVKADSNWQNMTQIESNWLKWLRLRNWLKLTRSSRRRQGKSIEFD